MKTRPLRLGHHVAYGALKLVLLSGAILPLSVLRWFGRTLIRFAAVFVARERWREDEHLKIAFPEMETDARQNLRKRSEIHFGNLLGEIAWLMHADESGTWGAPLRVDPRLCCVTALPLGAGSAA